MMELIRINPKDLEDLRLLLIYYKENEMDVDDINKLVMFLGKKYGFDPFKCAINILTGIVSERKNRYSPYDDPPVSIKKAPREPIQVVKLPAENKTEPLPEKPEKFEVIEETEGIKKIVINGIKSKELRKNPKDYLPELERWIKTNDLDYLKTRKLVSDLEYTKRMKEVTPGLVAEGSDYLQEFQDWIDSRGLNYLNIRMMLAILAQEQENRKREAVIAR